MNGELHYNLHCLLSLTNQYLVLELLLEQIREQLQILTYFVVGGASEPGGRTAIGAVESLLTSPCFRKRVESRHRHGACGAPSLLVLPGRARCDAGLVPRSPS